MKIANTRQLLDLNRTSASEMADHHFDHEFLVNRADPNGLHVLAPVGLRTVPYVRCMAFVKLAGDTTPKQQLFDVEPAQYELLPGFDDTDDLQADFVQKWNATL